MKKNILSATVILLIAVISVGYKKFQMHQNPVVAHRGAFKAKSLPENSVAALKNAISLNCAGAEFDIWMTADDSLVICHDPEFNHLNIETSTYKTLLNSGTLPNGESLPLLHQYLEEGLKDNNKTQLVLEIKPSKISNERSVEIAGRVMKAVKDLNAKANVAYISFNYDVVKYISSVDDNAVTQYLNGDKTPRELKEAGIKGLDYHYNVYKKNPEWIKEAKESGLILNVWTVNKVSDLQFFLDQEFDFITTNEPELLLTLLSK
ncbi:glycerophosphodiester phosphodiesterase family protein [Polluticaenibacter yanchengensis]|uniref:Glycerophosphodiester phosphodiesterase family protein n=1 Tax=Polluticaenibacter yanchengensis TaxID=3014562 RepID=A0ABT4UF04_9BACT|nr:glycerophosphodiester phosphodiesterase family protein [Chitinophagaceae bacterium LY-5]